MVEQFRQIPRKQIGSVSPRCLAGASMPPAVVDQYGGLTVEFLGDAFPNAAIKREGMH